MDDENVYSIVGVELVKVNRFVVGKNVNDAIARLKKEMDNDLIVHNAHIVVDPEVILKES